MKFQDKFYDAIDHNKLPSTEKEDKKCVSIKLHFHQILPNYDTMLNWCYILWLQSKFSIYDLCRQSPILNLPLMYLCLTIVKLREREGQRVDPGRSLNGHL